MSDTYKLAASLRPTSTSEALLYECPAAKFFIGTLYCCNQDSVAVNISVAITATDRAALGSEWIVYAVSAAPSVSIRFPITLGPLNCVRVVAATADKVSFVLAGLEG